jgi:hypothetical protein
MKNSLKKDYFSIIFTKNKFEKNIFVCYTPFHILISLLISFILNRDNNESCDIVIGQDHFNDACDIIKMIKNNIYWINNVYGINDKKVARKINKLNSLIRKTIKLLYFKSFYEDNEPEVGRIKINNNCRIFLFHDSPLLSLYFLKSSGNDYFLVEDGKGNYINKKDFFKKNNYRKIFGFYNSMGRHPKIKKILVQHPRDLPKDIQKKGLKLDLDYMINNISREKEKRMVCNVFPGYEEFSSTFIKYNNSKKKILLLTQPLSEDGLVDENEKVKYYGEIVKKYINEYIIFLKPHPRENTEYSKYFDRMVIILPKLFPVELFRFNKNIIFDIGISYSSSAIDNLSCIRDKITLNKNSDNTR